MCICLKIVTGVRENVIFPMAIETPRLDVENGTPRTLSVQSRGRTPFCERKIEDAAISPEFTSRPPHRKQWEGHMHVPYAFPI